MSLPMPKAFEAPSPELTAAWGKFIHNQSNQGHASRKLEGGNLQSHLAAVWSGASNSAERIVAQTESLNPEIILDLGASAGGLSLALCAQYPNARTIYALEPETEAYQTLCAMKVATHEDRLIPMHGGGEVLPIADGYVDLVVCHQVLEHVRNPKLVLAEIYRVLRPGGMVHLELPNYVWPIEPHIRSFFVPFLGKGAMKFLARLQGSSAADINFLNHLQLMTKPRLEKLLRAQGFHYYNLVQDKLFMGGNNSVHHIYSGWKRKALRTLQNNIFGRMILKIILALGFYPSLLYRLQKPAA